MANSTVQTLPLNKRLNANQQVKRAAKIQARATVANALAREIGLTRLFIIQSNAAQRKLNVALFVLLALLFVLVLIEQSHTVFGLW